MYTLLAAQLEEWVREWWISAADHVPGVRAIEQDAVQERRGLSLLSLHEMGSLVIHLGAKDFDAIGRFLAGITNDADFELSQRIGEEAIADLAARIQRRAGFSKITPPAKGVAPLTLTHARLGAFGVTAIFGRLQLELAIDRRMADRLAPPAAASSVNLAPRHMAIEQAPLKVLALMDFGSVDLAHLADLSVGEILVGDRKLNEALELHLQGHGAIATGYLRRTGEQRAVMLDGVNQQERPQP
ncbi:hypothetical protein ISP15_17510 [Dyella jejuensis]|uniref:Flagellar motor switch protein FliN-like C-terminal domain-containing protein n=1 Tax=Dyella jejuensis TaxID=1432009 RepID=A0ABW8JQL7_9GAMM